MGKKTADKLQSQKSADGRLPKNLRIDEDVLRQFEKICERLGRMQSRVVEEWMKDTFIPAHRHLLEEGS